MPVMTDNNYTRAERLLPELKKQYEAGMSTNALAKQHGLRREAVSTVLTVAGVLPSTPGRDRVLKFVEENPGLSVDDIADQLEMPKSTVSRYLRGTPQQRLVITRKKSDYKTYSDEEKITALKDAWAELDQTQRSKGLSRARYDKLIGHKPDRPTAATFIRRWGTWTAACEAAGVKAAAARRSSYEQEFSDLDILNGINKFIDETGKTAFHEYSSWARSSGRASGPLVVIRFESWSRARSEAIKLDSGEITPEEVVGRA